MVKIWVEAYGCYASFSDSEMISGLILNVGHTLAENSQDSDLTLIVTLLAPKIGYLKSAELFKESLKTGKTIRELVISKKLLTNKEVNSLLG